MAVKDDNVSPSISCCGAHRWILYLNATFLIIVFIFTIAAASLPSWFTYAMPSYLNVGTSSHLGPYTFCLDIIDYNVTYSDCSSFDFKCTMNVFDNRDNLPECSKVNIARLTLLGGIICSAIAAFLMLLLLIRSVTNFTRALMNGIIVISATITSACLFVSFIYVTVLYQKYHVSPATEYSLGASFVLTTVSAFVSSGCTIIFIIFGIMRRKKTFIDHEQIALATPLMYQSLSDGAGTEKYPLYLPPHQSHQYSIAPPQLEFPAPPSYAEHHTFNSSPYGVNPNYGQTNQFPHFGRR